MKPRRVVLVAGLALAVPLSSPAFEPSGMLEIHIINIGHANAALVVGPNGTKVMLEAGRATPIIHEYLTGIGFAPGTPQDHLDYTLAGHLHTDHYGGFRNLFDPPAYWGSGYVGFRVEEANWFNGSPKIDNPDPGSFVYKYKAACTATDAGAPVAVVVDTTTPTLDLGEGAALWMVAADGAIYGGGTAPPIGDDENDRSVAVLIQYGDFHFLWASDLTGGSDPCSGRTNSKRDVETPLAEALTPEPDGSPDPVTPLLTDQGVDILLVNHHGSETSTNTTWMNRLKPEVAILSVGSSEENPEPEVVEQVLLSEAACVTAPPALVLQTNEGDVNDPVDPASDRGYVVGDIVILSDGEVYGIGATGRITEGPDERGLAQLPLYVLTDELAPDCPMEVVLENLRIDRPWVWQAKHTIRSASSVRVAAGGDVVLRAGTAVTLGNGFSVESDALLAAEIEPAAECGHPWHTVVEAERLFALPWPSGP